VNSTGNDIVALGQTSRERTLDFRFYSKILSESEKALYCGERSSGLPFEKFVWLLWSIKESVYKYEKRLAPDLLFTPTTIIVREINFPSPHSNSDQKRSSKWENSRPESGDDYFTGVVHWQNEIFYSRSQVQDELISTVVSCDNCFENTWWGFRAIDKSDSASLHFTREL
jgi:phosphopantetheinyl transferase (holo-ACP synthase)